MQPNKFTKYELDLEEFVKHALGLTIQELVNDFLKKIKVQREIFNHKHNHDSDVSITFNSIAIEDLEAWFDIGAWFPVTLGNRLKTQDGHELMFSYSSSRRKQDTLVKIMITFKPYTTPKTDMLKFLEQFSK